LTKRVGQERSLKRHSLKQVATAPRLVPAEAPRTARKLAEVRELLGPAWIVEGKHPERYEQLLVRVAEAVGPTDFVDWLLIKDIAPLTWEIKRSRRRNRDSYGRLEAVQQILQQVKPRAERPFSFDEVPAESATSLAAIRSYAAIERRREQWARHVQQAAEHVADVEFTDLPACTRNPRALSAVARTERDQREAECSQSRECST
jgi:hypothetical protein